ncbi:hypothetical protein MLD38_010497 [Melastoma candidum]|uniref:Uncharacterized protein n=1 Tax=Melastoma candidum TaxID=119954 RepID=A0ACB9R449_9MYRT|nr:hypothetical protein MLD38_010497 [Melastoma candidum]
MTSGSGSETKKGLWSKEEDGKLVAYIKRYGIWNWTHMPKAAGLARSGKSCRLRWMNYLRPNIRHGNFTPQEEEEIIRQQRLLGNRWSAIAAKLPGRTDNDIKNYWNTRLRMRVHAIDGDRNGGSKIPNSGNDFATSTGSLASESGSQDGICCSHDRSVIPDSSCDVSGENLPGVSSEEEIDSLWSELPPLGDEFSLLDHLFTDALHGCPSSNVDSFSIFGHQQQVDHANASSPCYYYVDKLLIDF